jgi:hypothetical protein
MDDMDGVPKGRKGLEAKKKELGLSLYEVELESWLESGVGGLEFGIDIGLAASITVALATFVRGEDKWCDSAMAKVKEKYI